MLTPQSAKELLHSLPCAVRFSGFTSDTVKLAQQGWDLSMEQHAGMYGDYNLQLAMRHGDKHFALYALSAPLQLRGHELHRIKNDPMSYSRFFIDYGFDIMYLANDIRMVTVNQMASQGVSFRRDSFFPIDPTPQVRHEESIQDFKFFKVIDEGAKELIVTPESVPELLALVLKAQNSTQAEIKQRMRSRENYQQYGDTRGNLRPATKVAASIVTLAV